MKIFIHVDSLYINVKYPFSDVYKHWAKYIEWVDHRTLKQGVVVDDFVLRTGGSGYKFSIWRGDIRAFLTPDTDQERGEGNGMGIWIQMGPQFINTNGWGIQEGVLEFLSDIGVIGEYSSNITRLDLAIDIFDFDVNTMSFDEMRLNWVGRSELTNTHTGNNKITGFDIGSRKSAVYLRIYNKMLQAEKEGDLDYWMKVWEKSCNYVTRFEWQVAPKKGNFQENLTNFHKLNQESIKQLMDYLLNWGRLAIPNENDKVKSRWVDTSFWAELRKAVRDWNPDDLEKLKRIKVPSKGFSPKYANQLAGVISGGMARCNPEKPNYVDMFEKINEYVPLQEITMKAKRKGKRIQNLTQKNEKGENNDNG